MLFGKKPPYTNTRDLNLDWILEQMCSCVQAVESMSEQMISNNQALLDTMDTKISAQSAAISKQIAPINAQINGINAQLSTLGTLEVQSIYEGNHYVGSNPLRLSDGVNLADFDFFVVEGYYQSSSYPFRAIGIYQPSTYKGEAISASVDYYSSGGYVYNISLTLATNENSFSHVSVLNSSGSFNSSVYITKICGYKAGGAA